ncbi:MAG TPA: amidohydrolase [Thermoleophilaceae bacterium]|nr:amidohydrolase [Thermoleophilaceae bacterium]
MCAGSPTDLTRALEASRPATERICSEVWELAELSHEEVASAAVHVRELESAGFTVTSGTSGLPTAFVAEWSQGAGAKVGFLAEYDALPGLGNAALPRQEARADGQDSGHGCGHNLLGGALTGAAIAAMHQMRADGIPGTLRVYGCAGEETEGAKVFMARDGLFDDLDGALHWHPGPDAAVMNFRLAAAQMLEIEFLGRSAHAGMEPWSGRSALHAMELAAHGINVMREHLEPSGRVHYVFLHGGQAANIVTDYARMAVVVRDLDRARVQATGEWVQQIAAGAAMATQTTSDSRAYFGMHDVLPNAPLAQRMQAHLERVGPPDWSVEEQEFARSCQREMGLAADGLCTQVTPLLDEPAIGGSSDVGDVSWTTPTMGIVMPTMPVGVSLHSWPVTACGGMSIGVRSAQAASQVLTHTALDLLTDAELRASARADFERRTGGRAYQSLLSAEQKRPRSLEGAASGAR